MGDWGIRVFQDDHAIDFGTDIAEAVDPNAFIEKFLRSFLGATESGYDRSECAEDWSTIRRVLAACEIVCLGMSRLGLDMASVPRAIREWLATDKFQPSSEICSLALESCHRLVRSDWLRTDSPEMWEKTIGPLLAELGGRYA